jgi:hypothetical protein
VEFIGQHGHSQIGQVRAWSIGADAAYQLPGSVSPRVGTRIDIGSGDKKQNDGVDNTYDYTGSRGMTDRRAGLLQPYRGGPDLRHQAGKTPVGRVDRLQAAADIAPRWRLHHDGSAHSAVE